MQQWTKWRAWQHQVFYIRRNRRESGAAAVASQTKSQQNELSHTQTQNHHHDSDHIAVVMHVTHGTVSRQHRPKRLCLTSRRGRDGGRRGLEARAGIARAQESTKVVVVGLVDGMNFFPTCFAGPNCWRWTWAFLFHVDDGLLLGLSWAVQHLIDQLSSQVMVRIVGRLEGLSDQISFVAKMIMRTARGYAVEAN